MKSANLSRPISTAVPQHSVKLRTEPWRSPDHITTFLRCLHLLNLDKCVDWPGINEQTLLPKSALQSRLKCIEWSLYRLFEVYDPDGTSDKLRPFFPPSSPLHSLNLRAALFRSLTELKKNGVLPRDVVLRKTMLEECKGDKFEEVIGTFAMLVVREKLVNKNPYIRDSVSSYSESTLDQIQLVPLILAHRTCLQETLSQRKQFTQQAHSYETFLEEQEVALRNRRAAIQSLPGIVNQEGDALEELVRDAWTGNETWATALLHGIPKSSKPFPTSFGTGWESIKIGSTISDDGSPTTMGDKLEASIAEHKTRLDRWRMFQSSLENARKTSRAVAQSSVSPNSTPNSFLKFERHHGLHLEVAGTMSTALIELLPSHEALLELMKNDLSALNQAIRSPCKRITRNNSWENVDEVALVTSQLDNTHVSTIRPINGKMFGSSADLNEAQKVIQPTSSWAPGDNSLPSSYIDAAGFLLDLLDVQEVPVFDRHTKGIEMKVAEQTGQASKDFVTPERPQALSSLSERTQKSMEATINHTPAASTEEAPLHNATPSLPPSQGRADHLTTLLERTRKSMAALPNPPQKSRKARESLARHPRSSQVFPVNQFETPVKARAPRLDSSPGSGASTPRDKLFSEEAEYASVFKSRPRVALSPALSPERSMIGMESLLEDGAGEIMLDETEDSWLYTPITEGRQ